MSVITRFQNWLFGTANDVEDNVVGGADEVFSAILENANGEKRFVTQFGEPKLVDRGGQYSTDYMVQIPTTTRQGEPEPPNIEYDLPDAEMGDNTHELFELLDYYDIDEVSDLGSLEGEQIMAAFQDGVLSFQFDAPNPEVEE